MHVHCVCLCSHGHLVLVGGVHIQMDERVCAPATSAYHASVYLYAYAYTSMHVRILQVGPNSSGSNHLHCAGIEFWYGLRRTHTRTHARRAMHAKSKPSQMGKESANMRLALLHESVRHDTTHEMHLFVVDPVSECEGGLFRPRCRKT